MSKKPQPFMMEISSDKLVKQGHWPNFKRGVSFFIREELLQLNFALIDERVRDRVCYHDFNNVRWIKPYFPEMGYVAHRCEIRRAVKYTIINDITL